MSVHFSHRTVNRDFTKKHVIVYECVHFNVIKPNVYIHNSDYSVYETAMLFVHINVRSIQRDAQNVS